MSAESRDTSFDRWALLGAIALGAVGLAAFLSRHTSDAKPERGADLPSETDILRVRIGGVRPDGFDADAASRIGDPPPPGPGGVPDAPLQPPPEDAPPPQGTRTVTVQPGETLGQIVQRELGTIARLDEVIQLNEIENADEIRAGTELKLPRR